MSETAVDAKVEEIAEEPTVDSMWTKEPLLVFLFVCLSWILLPSIADSNFKLHRPLRIFHLFVDAYLIHQLKCISLSTVFTARQVISACFLAKIGLKSLPNKIIRSFLR